MWCFSPQGNVTVGMGPLMWEGARTGWFIGQSLRDSARHGVWGGGQLCSGLSAGVLLSEPFGIFLSEPSPEKRGPFLKRGSMGHRARGGRNSPVMWGASEERGLGMALRHLTPKGTKREARLGRTSAAGVQVRGSAEVSLRQEEWSHQRPQVEQQPGPAGADLHPHGCPRADHLPGLSRSVPVGECHHDMQ